MYLWCNQINIFFSLLVNTHKSLTNTQDLNGLRLAWTPDSSLFSLTLNLKFLVLNIAVESKLLGPDISPD